MSVLTLDGPAELETRGYLPPVLDTLEMTPAYGYWRQELAGWTARLPGLRTPRNPDGTGGTPPGEHQLRHSAIALQRRHSFWAWVQGCQKCLAKGTEVLMLDGTNKKVEDIQVGDLLMGPDSKARTVQELYRGREMMYRITSSKGDTYTVNESHILSLKRSGGSTSHGKPSGRWKSGDVLNITVRDYLKLSPNQQAHLMQYKVGVEFSSKSVPLDPYFLGLWLGDGSSKAPAITTADPEIVEFIHDFAAQYTGLSVRKEDLVGNASNTYFLTSGVSYPGSNPVRTALMDLNVWGNKHIPADYKVNDRETRLQLLAGLIDTDGSMAGSRKNSYHVTFKSKQLAEDTTWLARSLGLAAYCKEVSNSCTYKGEVKTGTYFQISIWGATSEVPTRIPRKQASIHTGFKDPLVAGIIVEPVGVDDYYGFSIDGDHLFVLSNFVVTHNTMTAILALLGFHGHQLFAGLDGHTLEVLEAKAVRLYLRKYGTEPEPGEVRGLAYKLLQQGCTLPPGAIHIVCPRHVMRQVWMRELARVNLDWATEVVISEEAMHASKAPIWIYHFDTPKELTTKGKAMKRDGTGLRLKAGGGTYFWGHRLGKVIARRYAPSLLICDELHRLRADSERTECMKLVRRHAKRVIGLTGTPMDGWVSQAATILGFVYGPHSRAYPFTDDSFSKRFTRTKVVNRDFATGGESVAKEKPVPGVSYQQIPAFIQATRHLMHRLNLTDPEVQANVVFPKVVTHRVVIPMDFEHQLFYQDHHREGLAELKRLAESPGGARQRQNVLTLMTSLRQAATCPWSLGYAGTDTSLQREVVNIVRAAVAEGRKVLIGTTLIEESRYLHDALAKAGFRGVRLYGTDPSAAKKTLSPEAREVLIERYMEDPDCVYLVSNKELVAEGLNLAETASVLVSCSNGYRANIEQQWRSRVIRPGQSWSHVDEYVLLTEGTIAMYIYQMLLAKTAATASLIDLDFSVEVDSAVGAIDPLELARRLTAYQESEAA
jgi:hypothetical protein